MSKRNEHHKHQPRGLETRYGGPCIARPNILFDAAALDKWAREHCPDAIDEWWDSGTVGWLDLWYWLKLERGDALDAFIAAWRHHAEDATETEEENNGA